MNLPDLLNSPEGKTLEFKRDASSLKPILKTLVAFANTAGGTLVIGREDNGSVVGVGNVLQEEERLANAIADGIRPAMTPEIDICSHDGKSLLLVHVPHWRGPFYVKAEGAEDGVYVRLGSTNRRAGPELLAELQRALSGLSFDQMPCPDVSADDLDAGKVGRFFSQLGRDVSQEHLETLGVLVPQGGRLVPSHGGLILFGSDAARRRLFPEAEMRCARFRGTDKVEFIDRLDLEGTVLEALDEAPKFIRRNTRLAAKIETMRRQDIPEYPVLALREVLVNAVAHADYSLTGMRLRVAIYADRLEVENPGMLPFGMTLDDFKAGVSRLRNRVIARVLRELGLVEEWGTGYLRITEACREGGYPAPEWEEHGPCLRVVFRPHPEVEAVTHVPADDRMDDTVNDTANETVDVPGNVPGNVPVSVPANTRQEWLLEQLARGQRTKAADVATKFDVTEKTAKRDIADLRERGLIEFVGARKTGHYRLKERS